MTISCNKYNILRLILFTIFIGNSSLNAQNNEKSYVEIKLKNDSLLVAELLKINEEYLDIDLLKDTTSNNRKVYFSDIARYTIRSPKWFERYQTRDTTTFRHRTLLSNNLLGFAGYHSKKGRAYYQNIFLFGHYGGYSITDRLMVEGGTELVSLLIRPHNYDELNTIEKLPAILASVKYSLLNNNENFDVSIGGLSVRSPYSSQLISANALFGEASYRSKRFMLNFGIGVVPVENVIGNQPLLKAGANIKIGKRVSIITNNWLYQKEGSHFSYNTIGIRCELKIMAIDFFMARIIYTHNEGGLSFTDETIAPRVFTITFPFSNKEKYN